ncbi:ATP-binding domain-containing protein [Bacteroides sp. AN502(2024)]|uniref:C-terminal helicase domain-containing protein n=1 Tax=Bacteroides sp. AN502(2024) TaxID=3160599 RepID=UPI00351872FC
MQKSKFTLTEGQRLAFEKLLDFVRDKEAKVFILKGYAGTGKTSMMKVLIGELTRRNLKFSLLASTGRAAKILSNATQVQQKELFVDFYLRMKKRNLRQKDKEFKAVMMKDPYLNALRSVFGYALTCHKVQGGEWETVFLDIPRSVPVVDKPYVYQWVYTAMTRAKKELYVVDDFWVM